MVLQLPRVVPIFKKERPEQLRGVGMLAGVLEQLKMISDLSDAELFASVMSAMIAVVYKSPGAGAMPEPDYGEEGEDDAAGVGHNGGPPLDQPTQYRFESGSVMEIDSEAEIEALYMQVRSERAHLGGDLGVPFYVCFLAEKVARGDYVMPGFFRDLRVRAAWTGVDWRGDGKISLNPLQEAKGFEVQQANNWRTGEEITAELTGGSYRENIARRGAEHRACVAEGLPIATQPGAAKSAPPEADDKKDDE